MAARRRVKVTPAHVRAAAAGWMDSGEITLPLLGSQEQKMYTIMIMEF